jgi:8-oxo-dGTP diphosphatase
MPSRELMVVGYLFDQDLSNVLLLRKAHPEWQAGRLNGVGGHCEQIDISFADTMRREFFEEVGIDIPKVEWRQVAEMYSHDWMVVAFCVVAPFATLQAAVVNTANMEEKAEILPVCSLCATEGIIGNVRWLVPMAIDKLSNPGAFNRALVEYLE